MTHKVNSVKFHSYLSISLFMLLFSYGCSRKEIQMSNNYELQKQRSLELEAYHQSPAVTKQAEVNANSGTSAITTFKNETPSERLGKINNASESVVNSKGVEATKAEKRAEKLQQKFEKKSIKLKKYIENKSELNSNLKLGIILILVGILIAVILGALVHGVFGAIGAIVAIIGIVFLILGLLEM